LLIANIEKDGGNAKEIASKAESNMLTKVRYARLARDIFVNIKLSPRDGHNCRITHGLMRIHANQ
jgi:hypothetical protein